MTDAPPSPDAESPLSEHEEAEGRAYIYGKRSAQRGQSLNNPYFQNSDQGYAYRSGFVDGMAQKR